MKTSYYWLLSAVLLTGVVVGGLSLSSSVEARPFPSPACTNGCPNETTAPVSGRGATCASARARAESRASNLANQFCTQANGLCTFSFAEQGAGCFLSGSSYQVNGVGIFTCDLC